MRRIGFLLLLLAIVALGYFTWNEGSRSDEIVSQVDGSGSNARSILRGEGGTIEKEDSSQPQADQRVALNTRDAGSKSKPPTRTVLVGRCVSEEDGAPVVRATLRCVAVPHRAETDREGRFAYDLSLDRPPEYFQVFAEAPGRLSLENHVIVPKGTTLDVGDVVMPRGTTVRGRVVDLEGQTVPFETLLFINAAVSRTGPGWSQNGRVQCPTGPVGSFEVQLTTGTHSVYPKVHVANRPKELKLEPWETFRQLDVVVARRDAKELIFGTVSDPTGMPLPGVRVNVVVAVAAKARERLGPRHLVATVVTEANGSFHVGKKPEFTSETYDGGKGVWLRVQPSAPHLAFASAERIPWGARNVRVQLVPRDMTRVDGVLAVRSAKSGRPVEDYFVQFEGIRSSNDVLVAARRHGAFGKFGRHAKGELALRGLDNLRFQFTVHPRQPDRFFPAVGVLDLPHDRGKRLIVELPELESCHFRVRDREARPCRGSNVYVVAGLLGKQHILGFEQTDAKGFVTMGVPLGVELRVHTTGKSHLPAEMKCRAERAGQTIDVPVSIGATVQGRVKPLAVWRSLAPTEASGAAKVISNRLEPHIQLIDLVNRRNLPMPMHGPIQVDDQGRFEVRGVSKGRYRMQLNVPITPRQSLRIALRHAVVLRGTEGESFEIDLTGLRLTSLLGLVRIDGQPAGKALVSFHGKSTLHSFSAHVQTDAIGRFKISRLIAGSYTIDVRSVRGSGSVDMQIVGQNLQRTIEIQRRRLELRVSDRTSGRPIAGHRFETSTGPVVSDEAGILRWISPPREVFLFPHDKSKSQGPFRMKRGEQMTRIDVRW